MLPLKCHPMARRCPSRSTESDVSPKASPSRSPVVASTTHGASNRSSRVALKRAQPCCRLNVRIASLGGQSVPSSRLIPRQTVPAIQRCTCRLASTAVPVSASPSASPSRSSVGLITARFSTLRMINRRARPRGSSRMAPQPRSRPDTTASLEHPGSLVFPGRRGEVRRACLSQLPRPLECDQTAHGGWMPAPFRCTPAPHPAPAVTCRGNRTITTFGSIWAKSEVRGVSRRTPCVSLAVRCLDWGFP